LQLLKMVPIADSIVHRTCKRLDRPLRVWPGDDHTRIALTDLSTLENTEVITAAQCRDYPLEQRGYSSQAPWVPTAFCLRERFDGRCIAVCLELAKGPIVSALQKYDLLVIFPVNPSALAKYREAWAPSGKKDDPSDSALALEIVIKHRDKLNMLRPLSSQMRALQQLVEDRRKLVDDRVRVTNRTTAALKAYFPQIFCSGFLTSPPTSFATS
jgi:hypothetical protein